MDLTWQPDRAPPSIPRASRDMEGEGHARPLDLAASRASRLVSRAREGDREAFGELYRLYQPRVWRLARFRLSPGQADDATAETFLRAWVALPRYRDTGAPWVSWLYAIARHVVADTLRASRRVEPRDQLPDRPVADEDRDERLALRAAVDRLPDDQRRVIELKFFIGLGNDEVAQALGKKRGAVNAQQWRALRALRRAMEER